MRKWRWTLVVVGMFCFGSVWGQFRKERVIEECEICELNDIQVADLDNDGDEDIITASWDKISLYRNEGSGVFSEQIVIFKGSFRIDALAIADMDGDGKKDIVFAITTAGWNSFLPVQSIKWIKNGGHNQFDEEITINEKLEQYGSTIKIQITDLDNDKDLDIITCFGTLFRNNGKNKFSQEQIASVIGNMIASDFDKDGFMDLIAEVQGHTLQWWKNDGKGGFKTIIIAYNGAFIASPIGIDDLDNDGDNDLVFGVETKKPIIDSTIILIYKNQGGEKFSSPVRISTTNGWISNLKFNDLDKDGDDDIIVTTGLYSAPNRVICYKNNGNGDFKEQKTLHVDEHYRSSYGHLVLSDFDKDQDVDIILGYEKDELGLLINDSKTGFSPFHNLIQSRTQDVRALKSVDLDGDGDLDILAVSYSENHTLGWFKNLQKGNFSEQIIIMNGVYGTIDAKVMDLDEDGDFDIALISGSGNVFWLKNEGNKGFIAFDSLLRGISCDNVCQGDLNGDGHLDIVISNASGENIQYYINKGNGAYAFESIVAYGVKRVKDLFLVDIDNDLDLDIVLKTDRDFSIQVFMNMGKARFTKSFVHTTNTSHPILLADPDNDGDQDILTSSVLGAISMYQNDGQGEFKIETLGLDSLRYPSLGILDMDKDGDLDIIGGTHDDKIKWLENKGNRIFNDRFISYIPKRTFTEVITPSDVDLDGDEDLLLAVFGEIDKISWLENLADHPSISGFAFWDENNNHKYDSSEQKIFNLPVNLEPTALASYTDAQGQYRFYAPEGKYRISVAPDSCWELSTDSLSYQVVLEKNKALVRHFGFKPTSSVPKLKVRLNSAPTRCGFEVPFWLSLHNEACLFTQGRYGLVLSKLADFVQAEPAPSQIQGDTLFWDVDQLFGSQTKSVKLLFRIAGTDFLGDTILMHGLAYVKNNTGQLLLANTYDYRSEIRCAYDPNDKLVQPTRIPNYKQNFTLFKERMEYTIRFQNTGTDTAFTVVIRDTLDGNLDWKTFKPIMASHPVETHLGKDGAVEFLFRNILLPPTKTNEPLSHGFVRYQVSAKAGLAEQTEIANTAHIYFDYNPSIITNTTGNIMVSALPKKGGGWGQTGVDAKVYPNPFFDYLQVEIVKSSTSAAPYTFYLQNSQAQVLLSQQLNGVIERIDTGQLPSGLYFYLIKDVQGRVVASGKVVCR